MKLSAFFLLFLMSQFGFTQIINPDLVHDPKFKKSRSKPKSSFEIDSKISEGSGLTAWNGKLWTHNDSDDSRIFALDTVDGKVIDAFMVPAKNKDWEEISHDNDYFYLGDFGNNAGKRDTVRIYRIKKTDISSKSITLSTISFAWPNRINPDCEAMVVLNDSIYLFTKEWKTERQTRVFSLPKQPGKYEAKYKSTLKTRVLITGASFHEDKKRLVLCGYNLVLRPFLLVFENISGTDFFSGKSRRIKIKKRFRQVEGIATFDGNRYHLISEDFHSALINTKRKLMSVDID